ncbi:MAG: hypothetical protein NT075_26260 [Chloroflexi bacterium]|nr:hypothetical protein [Chloroflexota bacterium]
MMRSKWLSLGTGLGLLLLLVAFALLVSRRSAPMMTVPVAAPVVSSMVGLTASTVVSTSQVISASQAITHSDWLTFTDPEAGYSIQYPANFVVSSSKSKGEAYNTTSITFIIPNVKAYQEMHIRVEPNPQNLEIEVIVEAIYQRINGRALDVKAANTLEQINVAKVTAYKTSILPGSTDFHILLPYNKKVYNFALVHDLGAVESSPEAKAIFFQLLATFQLTNGE